MKINYYKCPDCNKKLKKGDPFCPYCGCKIDWEENPIEQIKEENTKPILIILTMLFIILIIIGIILLANKDTIETNDDPRLNAKHILVDDYDTALNIIKLLNNNSDFCELAKEYSLDTSNNTQCGELGYFEYEDMEENFSNAVVELDIEEYTNIPIQTSYGYHVILRIN